MAGPLSRIRSGHQHQELYIYAHVALSQGVMKLTSHFGFRDLVTRKLGQGH